ncbi:MAG TPA: hypothetical protein VMC07_01685 [Candidatus Omnitrophota bacterium]|nr:hypothetical protein [Candidatus Omnitrophota bacterium]
MKKRAKKVFNNRLLYSLIALGMIIVAGIGVYAFTLSTAGVKPNPGHWINETAPPTGCTAGQVLQWKGDSSGNGGWACVAQSSVTKGTTQIYLVTNQYCTSAGAVTTISTCSTKGTGTCYGSCCGYYDCNGGTLPTCNTPASCSNTLGGYLVN